MAEFEDAKDKLMMGAERRTLSLTEEDKKLTAYHEAGHALLAIKMDASDPIHKATIIPRGRALGMVMRLPERDQVSLTRRKAYADLAVAMGGRVAEEEIFGYDKVTSGASADIKMATGLARAMATEWGMSDKLGPLLYGDAQDEVFLGRSMMQRNTHMSDETQQVIDEEVKRFVEDGYQTAQKVIRENIDDLHTIAKALLEYETLTGDEIRGLMDGQTPIRPTDSRRRRRSRPACRLPARRARSAPTLTRAPRPSRSRAANAPKTPHQGRPPGRPFCFRLCFAPGCLKSLGRIWSRPA